MAELRSQDKRDKLRLIWQAVQSAGQSDATPTVASQIKLKDALMAALKLCDDAISGVTPGTWLSSTSEAGGNVSFQMIQDYSPVVARRLIGEMLDAYDRAVEDITRITGEEPDEDEAIYNRMMKHSFRSIRKFRSDFTGGRYGVGFYLGTS